VKIAVVGIGAMGSVYAGLLASAGHEVWAVDPWQEHVEAIRERGLRVEGASGDRVVRLRTTTDAAEVGEAELVVIATKAMNVEAASESARVLVGPETLVLSIQNGLGGPDLAAAILGEERVAVGVAAGFGASIVEPGHVHHHGLELIRLGERKGPATPRIEAISQVWRAAGFNVQTYDDIDRLVWEKLICNVTFSGPCTVLGCTIGEVIADPHAWTVASQCAQEAFEVARALGVSDLAIIFRHVVPNTLAPVVVAATLGVGYAIILEASASFLGLGVQPPTASWGSMLYRAQGLMVQAPWVAIFPGLMILVTVMAINFLGDGLRDALDPRTRT